MDQVLKENVFNRVIDWQEHQVSCSTSKWGLSYPRGFSKYISNLLLGFLYEHIDSSIYYIN